VGEAEALCDWEPPPLSFLSNVAVKLLSQAEQVPYQDGELAFWTGDTVIPNNRGF
jgi:hypothetical protein